MNGQDLPASVRMGQRITGMTAVQRSFPVAGSQFKFARHGKSACGSASCCRTRRRSCDELCIVKSMHTEAINHDPAITFFQTGIQQAGRPSIGAWLTYGIGSATTATCRHSSCCISQGARRSAALFVGSGAAAFCPRSTRACNSAAGGDPVLYLSNPQGVTRTTAGRCSMRCASSNEHRARTRRRSRDQRPHRAVRDGVPHADGRAGAHGICRTSPKRSSTCTAPMRAKPARSRLTVCSRGGWPSAAYASSRLYHRGWDQHGDLPDGHSRSVPKTSIRLGCAGHGSEAAGLLDDTLVHLGR